MDDTRDEFEDAKSRKIQNFIFARELSEVYLLLDHISGRWDKSLLDVAEQSPEKANEWVEKICSIGWPPPTSDSTASRAREAAVLIQAKNRLNTAARPANGATIAFTLLVVGDDSTELSCWDRWMTHLAKLIGCAAREKNEMASEKERKMLSGIEPDGFPTRMILARTAFPGLITTAAKFERRITLITAGLLLWLTCTCLLSWYVSIGNDLATHLDAVHLREVEIEKSILAAERPGSRSLDQAVVPDIQTRTQPKNTARSAVGKEDKADAVVRYCDRPKLLPPIKLTSGDPVRTFNSVDEARLCGISEQIAGDRKALEKKAQAWVVSFGHVWLLNHLVDATWSGDEQGLRMLANVLVNSVLPLLFGVLGAGAAVVRGLWAKMRESLLSPRDYTLALGQLALGATIGACIGLFFQPTSNLSLAAGFTLTPSTLAFLGGFGVEGVFNALESLVRRVFNVPNPAAKPT